MTDQRKPIDVSKMSREELERRYLQSVADLSRLREYRRNAKTAYKSLQNAYNLRTYALMRTTDNLRQSVVATLTEQETIDDLAMRLAAAQHTIGEQKTTISVLRERLRSTKALDDNKNIHINNAVRMVEDGRR